MAEIKMYGSRWCGDTHRARKILDERKIDYIYIDINQDEAAAKFVEKINRGNRSVPTILFPDSSILVEPSNQTLIDKLEELQL